MRARDIAAVIPAHDDQAGLDRLLPVLRRLRFGQIVVVDDGSAPALRAPKTQVLRNGGAPRGAGWARNTGLKQVTKPWVLFLDADDMLLAPAFRALLRDIGDTTFDICLFQHHEGNGQLPPQDAAAWQAAGVGTLGLQWVPPEAVPLIAGIQNYPWNRLLRTAFLREHGIRCSETIVHNDIRLHWHGLVAARRVLAARRICIDHRPGRLSAIRDARRLHLLTALQETAALLPQTPAWQRAFRDFSRTVRHWARQRCPAGLALHFADPPTPALLRRAPLRFRLVGPHAQRTPLSYPDLRPFWQGRLHAPPDGPVDLQIIAHPQDAAHALPGPLLLLSEEPLWDLLFNPDPAAEAILLPTGAGSALVPQITHSNSTAFATMPEAPLPYYPLTENRFAATYRQLFTANANRSAADWQRDWPLRRWQTALLAAHRPEPFNAIAHADLQGLSAARTALAAQLAGPEVLVMGTGWQGAPPRGAHWHRQKIALLNRQARVISAIENTLQRDYLSEKLFDALACGALPLTIYPEDHAAHRLGLPPALFIAPDQLGQMGRHLSPATARLMARAQQRMATLWGDATLLHASRQRFFDRLVPLVLARA